MPEENTGTAQENAPEEVVVGAAESPPVHADVQVERFSVAANFAPASADANSRTIDAVWYAGAKIPRFDWRTGEEYDLQFDMNGCRMDRLNNGAAVLDSHRAFGVDSQLGVVRRAWARKSTGMATIQFSPREEVTPIWNDVFGGIIQNLSPHVDLQESRYHARGPGAAGIYRNGLGAIRDLARLSARRRGHQFHVGGGNATGATECS